MLSLIAYFGYKKFVKLQSIFEKVTISIQGVKNFKIQNSMINFFTSVKFTNPTSEDLSVNGFVAKLVRLNFFYNQNFIATAYPDLSQLEVPANNVLILPNIPVSVPLTSLALNITDIANFNIDLLTTEAVIEVAGNEFIIQQ